jgi:NTE family protein
MKRALILSGGGARGIFQIGVWKYLLEIGWTPDLICGTSIGAINAVAIGTGMPLERMMHIWQTYHNPRLYRLNLIRFLASALFGRPPAPILDTSPMRTILERHLDLPALRRSRIEIIITAINLSTGRLHLFNQHHIAIEHVLASSAVPIIFPCQPIQGELYWDGGVMANTPLFPALDRGAEEIIVVLHSPVGHASLPPPGTLLKAAELVFEHSLIGSYQAARVCTDAQGLQAGGPSSPLEPSAACGAKVKRSPKILTVAPSRMLGFRSLLNFSSRQADRLINEGYRNARAQLGHHL